MFLLNNKRSQIVSLEEKYKLSAIILADGRLTPGEYEFELETCKFTAEPLVHAQDPSLAAVEQEIDEEDLKPSTLLDDELEQESALAEAHAARESDQTENVDDSHNSTES